MYQRMFRNEYMELAIELAKTCKEKNEIPVAAVIVKDCSVIASNHNQTILMNDNTMHAEMVVLREAALKLGSRILSKCDIYVTLEPCKMCMHAISISRIKRLYFGSSNMLSDIWHGTEVYGGLYEEECSQLLKNFFL